MYLARNGVYRVHEERGCAYRQADALRLEQDNRLELAMKIELSVQALLAVVCLLWIFIGGTAEGHTEALALLLLVLFGRD